jgi:hypothetical protein
MKTMMKCGAAIASALGVSCALSVQSAAAQMRPDQPLVLTPPPPPAAALVPDFAGEFRPRYTAAGEPRIMLFWNVELSDRTRSDVVLNDHASVSGSKTINAQRQTSRGWDGSSSTLQGNAQVQAQGQREISVGERQDARRADLAARDAARLQRAFEGQMRAGGTQLIDRALATRTAAVQKGAPADGQKQAEAEALRGKADLLLQVLLVPDTNTPLGYGFDVVVRRVDTGAVLTGLYTLALPLAPQPQSQYAATDRGFVPRTPPPPSLEAIGAQLAGEVMNELGPTLPLKR